MPVSKINASPALVLSALLLELATLANCSAARAQPAGHWIARLGVTHIVPDVNSGDLSAPSPAGSKFDITSDTQPSGGITYMLSDHLSVDLPLAAGFRFDVVAAGTLTGVGKLADVKGLPVTVMVQWRFGATDGGLRPYVGLGPTYAYLFRPRSTTILNAISGGTAARPTLLDMDSKLTVSAQLGSAWRVAPRLALDLSVMKTPLRITGRLSTGQSIEMKVDPWSVSAALAYSF